MARVAITLFAADYFSRGETMVGYLSDEEERWRFASL
jgi:hypothetical protein